ncbi:nephrocystin-1 isoform X2 [Amblyraja radiata]|uniref:nephrocystin-1 isoform X2 n=1 Tax=Amblyraja radiata TaxID=386614 RepID=UPI0014021E77|nr:nephrocystin-1 isoform X2 [Amblyraja radiata]
METGPSDARSLGLGVRKWPTRGKGRCGWCRWRQTACRDSCLQIKKNVDGTLDALRKLKKGNEITHVQNYEQRKHAEERRLMGMSELLQELARRLHKELLNKQIEAADKNIKSKAAAAAGKQRKKSDEDDEDADEEEEEGSDEDEESDGELFITISDFRAQEKHDLSVKKGEVITIVNQNPDGWWLAKNAEGKEGLVPKTYLQVYSQQIPEASNINKDEEEEEEEDADESEEEDEEEEEEDDEEDEDDEEPKTKSNKLKVPEMQSEESRAHKLSAKKVVSEITAVDMLVEKAAIPEGFRASTLAQLLAEGNKFHMSYFLQPMLTQSNLCFKDLHLDKVDGGVRPRKTHTELMFILWSCKMIPFPVTGVEVLSRQVRCCLFDGQRVLSNIHTVRATWQSKNPKTWTFSPRVTGILPSLLDGECFVRSNSQSPEIGILFEVGITYVYHLTGHRGDLSCGWVFLPLFTADGVPVPHRTYEVVLNGGTPYEKGLEVDPILTRRANFLEQILVFRKQPKLLVKLKPPAGYMRNVLKLLPETLVGPKCYAHLLAYYRQLLAEALLKDRINMDSADLICNPVLATFSELLEQTDIVDALRSAWSERELTVKRSEKRDEEFMRRLFVRVYHDSVYPLLRSTTLPTIKQGDDEAEVSRWKDIANFLHQTAEKNGSLYSLLSPEHAYRVFDISEISYDFLGLTRKAASVD